MWADWQNAKSRGLRYAQDFIRSDWAMKRGFDFTQVSQELLNKILKGELKTFDEIEENQQKEISGNIENLTYNIIFYYNQYDEGKKENLTIIDSVFINL